MIFRLRDIVVAITASIFIIPILLICSLLVWAEDRRNPFYVSWRIGFNGKPFRLFKLRTMISGADRSKVDTTLANDPRITRLGTFLRRYKIDELPQLVHVLRGQMSIVGPRPNVAREVDIYTDAEREILNVKPGLTDYASIAFADLGERLEGQEDANIAYNQLVRPIKGRLGVHYVQHKTFILDLKLIFLTVVTIFAKKRGTDALVSMLRQTGFDEKNLDIIARKRALEAQPPLGSDFIVNSRA